MHRALLLSFCFALLAPAWAQAACDPSAQGHACCKQAGVSISRSVHHAEVQGPRRCGMPVCEARGGEAPAAEIFVSAAPTFAPAVSALPSDAAADVIPADAAHVPAAALSVRAAPDLSLLRTLRN